MFPPLRLGRISKIRINVHYSVFIVILLFILTAIEYFGMAYPAWDVDFVWSFAFLLLFVYAWVIFLHECIHVAAASLNRLLIRSITVLPFGGIAETNLKRARPGGEVWMGISAGCVTALFGLFFLNLAKNLIAITKAPDHPALVFLTWSGYIHLAVAALNALPAFPLDGGRVLRGILWKLSEDELGSSIFCARIAQFLSFSFMVIGLFLFFGGANLSGLWITLCGWFLFDAAGAALPLPGLSPGLAQVPDLLGNERRCFIVQEKDQPVGFLTGNELRKVKQKTWGRTAVREVMKPIRDLYTLSSDTSLAQALEAMGRVNVNQIPVVSDGEIKGILGRGHILRFLHSHSTLKL